MLESKKNNGFKVTVNDGVYSVEADWLYRILSKTDLDDYASLQYFQTVLKSSGIIDELVNREFKRVTPFRFTISNSTIYRNYRGIKKGYINVC